MILDSSARSLLAKGSKYSMNIASVIKEKNSELCGWGSSLIRINLPFPTLCYRPLHIALTQRLQGDFRPMLPRYLVLFFFSFLLQVIHQPQMEQLLGAMFWVLGIRNPMSFVCADVCPVTLLSFLVSPFVTAF